jgi:hypothetical protein
VENDHEHVSPKTNKEGTTDSSQIPSNGIAEGTGGTVGVEDMNIEGKETANNATSAG